MSLSPSKTTINLNYILKIQFFHHKVHRPSPLAISVGECCVEKLQAVYCENHTEQINTLYLVLKLVVYIVTTQL